MGRNRGKRQDESAAEISLKLHETLNVDKAYAFKFWVDYQDGKKNGVPLRNILNYLNNEYKQNIMFYFAALAMEIISKEIIEGTNIDKKEN